MKKKIKGRCVVKASEASLKQNATSDLDSLKRVVLFVFYPPSTFFSGGKKKMYTEGVECYPTQSYWMQLLWSLNSIALSFLLTFLL